MDLLNTFKNNLCETLLFCHRHSSGRMLGKNIFYWGGKKLLVAKTNE